MREKGKNGNFACPCCGYATLGEEGGYEICVLCFWEDDGQDDPKADENWGGPNSVSLTEARINFLQFGASTPRRKMNTRKPNEKDEVIRKFKIENGLVIRS